MTQEEKLRKLLWLCSRKIGGKTMNYENVFNDLKLEIEKLYVTYKSEKLKNISILPKEFYWWEEGFCEAFNMFRWKYENMIKILIKELEGYKDEF